jgi:tRNA (cytidine/uridine-2'-O-)-methyltransferase
MLGNAAKRTVAREAQSSEVAHAMAEADPKLRCEPLEPPFHVVLHEPEIPPNTGSVARTCAATSSPLHLIRPLGFRIDEHAVRRAGLDYWHLVDLRVHDDWAAFEAAEPGRRVHLFSANTGASYLDADLQPGDALVFGRESVGLPGWLLARHPSKTWGIPTSGGVRSLNLSNAVAIVLYEALRRSGTLARRPSE